MLIPNEDDVRKSPFEQAMRWDDEENEFWSARDLLQILEYANYAKFKNVLLKAQIACENSGQDVDAHFFQATKIIMLGSDATRQVEDMHLSRYACYLVVQNADPRRNVVALGQTYFAIQTRRQELADEAEYHEQTEFDEDAHRLILRKRVTKENKELASVAKAVGVITSQDFAIFQNHGYKGLYNGLTAQDIHKRKGLKKHQQILDHMGSIELSANSFRSTQAQDKLRRENIQGKDATNKVHYDAGVIVRKAIAEMGGTMPENLPAADSIKKLERKQQKQIKAPKKKDKSSFSIDE